MVISRPFLFLLFSLLCSIQIAWAQENAQTGLQAILVVGHSESNTSYAIERMDRVANLFLEHGITVHRFYDDKAEWADIVDVAKSCHFFVYNGHGSRMGKEGNAGGLCINSMVSSSRLMDELRLQDNALVCFQSVCNGAGSSAGDDDDIGLEEARNRVMHYAYPFFEIGASAYYADNYESGVYRFLEGFLKGGSVDSCYRKTGNLWTSLEFFEPFPMNPDKVFSIASSPGGGTAIRTTYTNGVKSVEEIINPKSYSVAFVGEPDFSLEKMKD